MNGQKTAEGDMRSLLVIDTGTSSMKGMLYSLSAQAIYEHTIEYSVEDDGNGTVEQDPLVFKNALCEIVREIYAYSRRRKIEIEAFSLTSQRSSLIAVDGVGNPLRKAMMWHDKRSSAICDEINAACDIYDICGMEASPVFSAPKMLWLKRNEPDNYQRARKLIGIHDYLVFIMTGEFVTDMSLASRTCLLDIMNKEWSSRLLKAFDVDPGKLCGIVPAGAVCGFTNGSFQSLCGLDKPIAVISAGGDQQCAASGLSSCAKGQIAVNCGTGAYACAVVEKPKFSAHHAFICNVAAENGRWTIEASALSSGMVYRWVKDTFYPSEGFEGINADALASEPGASGLIMLPNLMGKGMPYWDSYLRGIFYNIGLNTRKKHFARAALEGIAAELSDCVETISSASGDISQLNCSGGLSRNAVFNRVLADTCDRPVAVRKNCDGTCLGAWASAMVALGHAESFRGALDLAVMEDPDVYFPDKANHRIYRRANEARKLVYASLDTRKISELLGMAGDRS